jgi:hypothetical protein
MMMLAHCFLWYLKLRVGKKSSSPQRVSQLRTFLDVVLPSRTSTVEGVLAFIAWVQQRNHHAYRAHRVRRHEDG